MEKEEEEQGYGFGPSDQPTITKKNVGYVFQLAGRSEEVMVASAAALSGNPDGFRTKMAVSVEKKHKFTLWKSEEIFNAAKVPNPFNTLSPFSLANFLYWVLFLLRIY
ncbi:hypothetical protein MRB53_005942 [Persea americana]|uniref:Uncharacterized protein n=1 Tax=Persea americana TaxID=3435 RepID=A0ACC2MEZ8_PERAE|nr:hypothetical protein MRB53_005942 [Persea americana]